MNKKYLILGALLLVGGYIAYKKFYVNKEEETTDNETPVNRGVVAPIDTRLPEMVVSDTPSLVVPTSTTSTELVKNKLVTKDNVVTASQNLPSNFSFAGLGAY
jgi:hypothetical protein